MLQSQALDILKMGHNVYLTGAAGSGKTFVLNTFIDYLRKNKIVVGVAASTGIAATHMNGMTIHSWAGIGINDSLSQSDIDKLLTKSKLKKRFRETGVLIIDEVSMLHGKRLDMVDQVCRAFRDATKPFGGIQVVLSGDLFQLPPVTRGGEPDFVFNSEAWGSMNLKVCYLEEQHRQEDSKLLDVLNSIRNSAVDDSHFEYLQDRFREAGPDTVVTRLFTHNATVDQLNEDELAKIDSEERIYVMQNTGNKTIAESLKKSCLAPETLKLKLGADVMFVANSQAGHFANGTLGKVVAFDGDGGPIVRTANRTVNVTMHSWSLIDGEKTVAEIMQIPLRLAWAITVHKSQGMTLDAAEIDLSRSFEPGMGYVALSRVKTMDGLYIKGMNNTALVVHPEVSKLDIRLRKVSENTKSAIEAIDQQVLDKHHNKARISMQSDEARSLDEYDEKIYEELRKWRYSQAKEQSIPPYMVFADKTLKLIAAVLPKTVDEVVKLKGVGPQKLERYGEGVVELITRLSEKNQ